MTRHVTAFTPDLAVTGVGSLPHRDVRAGLGDMARRCPQYPYWPQFPRLDGREDMYRQFSAGLPGLREEPADGGGGALRWSRDAASQEALERVYADTLALLEDAGGEEGEVLTRWAVSPERARGLHAFRETLERVYDRGGATGQAADGEAGPSGQAGPGPGDLLGLKGELTGPVSLGLSVTGPGNRALLYEEDLMDGVVRGLALRARWEVRFLRDILRSVRGDREGVVLLSLDEPYLGTFGSAYFPYRPDTVRAYLDVFAEALDDSGAWWGVHCCANTDWEFLLGSPVRFVSFDAYAFGDRLGLYPEAVKGFLEAGKTLLWGIVPTTAEALEGEDEVRLAERLEDCFETLARRGVPGDRLARQSMVTPACGLAGLGVPEARRAMALASSVAARLHTQNLEL